MDAIGPVPRQAAFTPSRPPAGAPGDSVGDMRHATLRSTGASLTATPCRASFNRHGGLAGEGAR